MKKISIIIPTFNSEKYIKITLESIFQQNYQNFEIIICDNCSSDNTIKIIEEFSELDLNKFKIYIRKDLGVADALNFGFKKSTGDILCWLNSDDLYNNPFTLQNVINSFNQSKHKSYLVGNFLNIDKKGLIIKHFYSFIPLFNLNKFFYYNQIFTGSFFFKKFLMDDFGKFDVQYKYAFEYEIIIHCLKNYKGIYLNKFLSSFRILPTALSSNKFELQREFDKILKKNNLVYSNSIIYKIFIYFMQGVLFNVIYQKINFYVKKILFFKE